MTSDLMMTGIGVTCLVLALLTVMMGVSLGLRGHRKEGRVLVIYGTSVVAAVTGFGLATMLHLVVSL